MKKAAILRLVSDQTEAPVVSAEDFFDGNDDLDSIGRNLVEHPGIEAFRATLLGLLNRPDVDAVYMQIAELDPGEDAWPFTDTIFVVGTIGTDVLATRLEHLEPDEVFVSDKPPAYISARHTGPILGAWWD